MYLALEAFLLRRLLCFVDYYAFVDYYTSSAALFSRLPCFVDYYASLTTMLHRLLYFIDCHALSITMLCRLLCFVDYYASSTDSFVEAARCAKELIQGQSISLQTVPHPVGASETASSAHCGISATACWRQTYQLQ